MYYDRDAYSINRYLGGGDGGGGGGGLELKMYEVRCRTLANNLRTICLNR